MPDRQLLITLKVPLLGGLLSLLACGCGPEKHPSATDRSDSGSAGSVDSSIDTGTGVTCVDDRNWCTRTVVESGACTHVAMVDAACGAGTCDESGWCRVPDCQELVPTNPAFTRSFGRTVSISESLLVAGAHGDDGAVVFELQPDGSWVDVHEMVSTDQWFGFSAAVDESTVVVSAPRAMVDLAMFAGAVYVSRRDAGGGWLTERLTATAVRPLIEFGRGVALSSGTLLVGSPDGPEIPRVGAIHFFDVDATGHFVAFQSIDGSELSGGGGFAGWSVALRGDRALVGAPGETVPREGAGAAYVIERRGGSWVEAQRLQATDAWYDQYFGRSVALNEAGTVVVVGAPGHSGEFSLGPADIGAAYVFEADETGRFVATEQIQLPGAAGGESLGAQVAASGNVVAMMAAATSPGSGGVYIYEREDDGGWTPKFRIAPKPSETFYGSFVPALSLHGSRVAIGARRETEGGLVYVCELPR